MAMAPENPNGRTRSRSATPLFLALFLPLLVVFTASFLLFFTWERSDTLKDRMDSEAALVTNVQDSIAHDLHTLVGFLLLMAHNPTISGITASGSEDERLDLAGKFVQQTIFRHLSDKIHIFGNGYEEVASLDYTTEVPRASAASHQTSFCDRDLIRVLYSMRDGEIFLSPQPCGCEDASQVAGTEPMLHLGTPIVDRLGQTTGALLLHSSLGHVVSRLDNASRDEGRIVLLLDDLGRAYINQKEELSARGLFADASLTDWASRKTAIRDKARGRRTGQIIDQDGLLTFLTLWPRMEVQRFVDLETNLIAERAYGDMLANYSIKIFSFVPRGGVEAIPRRVSEKLLLFGALLILISGNGAWQLARSIVKRKDAQEALSSSEQHYRTLTESADDMIFIVDRRGEIQYMNVAASAIISRRGASARMEELFSETPSSDLARKLDEVFDTHAATSCRHEVASPQGLRWFETRMVPIRTEDGVIDSVMGVSRDITDQRRGEEQIRTTLKEKEILLREIHHRVKNNLHAVSGLLCIQVRPGSSPELVSRMKASQHRILSMALVHEKLYQSRGLGRIDFAEYLRSLTDHLRRSYLHPSSAVEVTIAAEGVTMNLDTAIPCGLIVNELVSNAFKYAFPNRSAGRVRIEMKMSENSQYLLTVCDNGVGLPSEPSVGAKSLGLRLVRDLVAQLGGRLEIDRKKGARFRMEFNEYAECENIQSSGLDGANPTLQ